jgi:ABC-type sugar transport system substrate-binding protein
MARTLRIGFNIFSVDPFWIEVGEAIYQRAEQVGVELVPVYTNNYLHLLTPKPEDEIEQITLIEEVLKQKLGAIIGWNFSGHLAYRLVDAGVPIISHGNEVPFVHPLLACREGLNAAGQMLGKYVVERLGGQGYVLVAGGQKLNTQHGDGRNRIAGFRDVFERYPQLHWAHVPASWGYDAASRPVSPLNLPLLIGGCGHGILCISPPGLVPLESWPRGSLA